MTPIRCFWICPTERVALWLRRFVYSDASHCPAPQGYHNAMLRIEDGQARYTPEGYLDCQEHAHDDPRWPAHCECGYAFQEMDVRQVFQDVIYDNGIPLREQPAGAMWDAEWWPDKGPDGRSICVRLPGRRDWIVDGPSSDGKKPWTRTGTPPNITVTPSIVVPGYHGWLRDGVLVDA